MKLPAHSCFLILFFHLGRTICRTYIVTGYEVTLAVPPEYDQRFLGRAFLIETEPLVPLNFKVALTVEPTQGNFSCSLQVFLGEVKVWSSGHFSRFVVTDICALQLTLDGDLRLKGPTGQVGWRTGTSGEGVEVHKTTWFYLYGCFNEPLSQWMLVLWMQKLRILRSGNLGLVDAFEGMKWQSFNFPTDVMLLGQSLNVATHLTSFPPNSTFFYSFEVQTQKIALYLNSPKSKYSYWEFNPPNATNLSFITLNAEGLDFFNGPGNKIATIPSGTPQSLSFLALGSKTGNVGLYYYSPDHGIFEASFRGLKTSCELPLACSPYGICTFSSTCSCIRLETKKKGASWECGEEMSGEFCGGSEGGMVELEGVSSILRGGRRRVNVSKEECGEWCVEDCECAAALHYWKECYVYREVIGVKQIEKGSEVSYMVKAPKGSWSGPPQDSSFNKWVLTVVCVVDGFLIIAASGGIAYLFLKRRSKNLMDTDAHS